MRRALALLICGLATLLATGCASPIPGKPMLPAGLPDPMKDIFNGADPCSLLPENETLAAGLRKYGLDDRYGPVCVYETPNAADEIEVAFMLRKDMLAINQKTLGKLTDTLVQMRPAKERRHPSNESCVLYLEPQRPIVAFVSVSTVEHTQDQSCQLAAKVAALAGPTIRDGKFAPYEPTEDSARPGGGDPCGLLSGRQAGKLRLKASGPSQTASADECEYTGKNGIPVTIGYNTPAGSASTPGEPTDITIAGQPAQEKRQPYNSYCTIVLLPQEETLVTVAVGGSPKFPQDKNCRQANQIATSISTNLD